MLHRLTKRVFLWDLQLANTSKFSTWSKETTEILNRNKLTDIFTNNIFDVKTLTEELKENLLLRDTQKLTNQCKNLPKLRTFKQISDFSLETSYLSQSLTFVHRKALSKCSNSDQKLGGMRDLKSPPQKEYASNVILMFQKILFIYIFISNQHTIYCRTLVGCHCPRFTWLSCCRGVTLLQFLFFMQYKQACSPQSAKVDI